jgi:hypothetical protein
VKFGGGEELGLCRSRIALGLKKNNCRLSRKYVTTSIFDARYE